MNLSLARHLFALEFKRAFAYRTEFWLGFLGNAATQFTVAYLLWAAVFAGTGAQAMRGFTLPDLALYYLLVPLIQRVALGTEMSHISGEIYDGTLTRFLLYPVAFFRFKFVSSLGKSAVYGGQLGILVGVYLAVFGVPPAFRFVATGILPALLALALSTALYFALSACLEMVAFWADNVWSLMILNRMVLHFLGGGLIPMAFFPDAFRSFLNFTPFPYLTAFPIDLLMGRLDPGQAARGFAILLLWTAVFSFLASAIWKKGCRRYSGVGI